MKYFTTSWIGQSPTICHPPHGDVGFWNFFGNQVVRKVAKVSFFYPPQVVRFLARTTSKSRFWPTTGFLPPTCAQKQAPRSRFGHSHFPTRPAFALTQPLHRDFTRLGSQSFAIHIISYISLQKIPVVLHLHSDMTEKRPEFTSKMHFVGAVGCCTLDLSLGLFAAALHFGSFVSAQLDRYSTDR